MEREEVGFTVGGTRCAAWLFRPEGPGPAPCVVLGSGLSCVRDQGVDRYSERFAAAGIAALAFDYRFFGDSEGEPRTLLSARMQREDFRAAVAFARTVPGIERARIAIWGFSYGSAHAQEIAISDPSIVALFGGAPALAGVSVSELSVLSIPAVKAAVSLIAGSIASLPPSPRSAGTHSASAASGPC